MNLTEKRLRDYILSIVATTFFFRKRVLNRSDDLGDVGGFQWELVACLALSWVAVYICIFKVRLGSRYIIL